MMINPDVQERIIELTYASNRALKIGNNELAQSLSKAAQDLIDGKFGKTFDQWAQEKGLNVEKFEYAYVSQQTQEFLVCWLAAGGVEP